MKNIIKLLLISLLFAVPHIFADDVEINQETHVTNGVLSSSKQEYNKSDMDNPVQSRKLAVRTDEKSILEGERLYEKWCQKCHLAYSTKTIQDLGLNLADVTAPELKGLLRKDTLPTTTQDLELSPAAITAPGLKGLLRKDALPTSKKAATAENVLTQISIPFGRMPAYGFLEEEEILNIIAFLNTL
jgi:cytochrome c2